MNTEPKKSRLLFLDNIKLLFAILVIFNHARVTYEGSGWWYYIAVINESHQTDLLSAIFFQILASLGGIFQASLLGLFFLMGGFLTPKSYDRKEVRSFWKERLFRLGIPIILYVVLINPIMFYMLSILGIKPWSDQILEGSFVDYYLSQFKTLEKSIDFLTTTGPMWFILVLLIFTFAYTLWRQITKYEPLQKYIPKELSIPRNFYLLLLSIILGCIAFIVRLGFPLDRFPLGLPFAYMIQYLMMFCVGIIAIRYNWFEQMTKEHIKVWSVIITTTVVLFFLYFFVAIGLDSDYSVVYGGPNFHALVFALVDNIICMGMIFVLIPIFKIRFNYQGRFQQKLSASAFHMYLIHAPILVIISLIFASISLFALVKLAIVFPLTVVVCYLASHYVIQKIL